MLGVVRQKNRFFITLHKVKTIYRPATTLLFILMSSFCDASYFLTANQKNQLDQALAESHVEILSENRAALEELVAIWLSERGGEQINTNTLAELEDALWPEFRLPPEYARQYLEEILGNPELSHGHKQFITIQILMPHMLDAGVCNTSDNRVRTCTFGWARNGVDLKGQVGVTDTKGTPLHIVNDQSPLAKILSLNAGVSASLFSIIGSTDEKVCVVPKSSSVKDEAPASAKVLASILRFAHGVLDRLVENAIAQSASRRPFDAGLDCVTADEIVVVSVSRDYWSLGSGYSAWGEWSAAYSAQYFASNADSLGTVLPFAAECNVSCLLHALGSCGGTDWLIKNQFFNAFFNKETDGKEDVLVCAAKKVGLKSRNLRGISQLGHQLGGQSCNTVPVAVETSPLFQEIRDREYTRTYYGKTLSVKLGAHAQHKSPYVSAPVTGSNMFPVPSSNSIDEGRLNELSWQHFFTEVRSQAFNLVFSAAESLNSNRSCSKQFSHPVRTNYKAWGDSAWSWFGAFSGYDKWELPEISWIAGYFSGHPFKQCAAVVDQSSLPTTPNEVVDLLSPAVNRPTDNNYDPLVEPVIWVGIQSGQDLMCVSPIFTDDSLGFYRSKPRSVPIQLCLSPQCVWTHLGFEVCAGYSSAGAGMIQQFSISSSLVKTMFVNKLRPRRLLYSGSFCLSCQDSEPPV